MKNLFKISFFLCLSFLIASCESNQVDQQVIDQPNNSGVLVSITEELQPNNYIAMTNFSDGKITDIQYNDGSYDIYEYENDLIKIINKYNLSDILETSTNYEYDPSGKMIRMIFDPTDAFGGGDYYTTSEFTYSSSQIIVTHQGYDSEGILIAEYQYEYTLANSLIVGFNPIVEFNSSFTTVEYINGNPINLTRMSSDQIVEFVELNYNDNIVPDAYNMNKYLFGNEWKNNGILALTPMSLSIESLLEIGNNYLTGYTSDLVVSGVNITNNVTYQFNSENMLLQQTRTKTVGPNNQTFIDRFTYEYE